MTLATMPAQINDFANRADPYPLYAALRESPVTRQDDGRGAYPRKQPTPSATETAAAIVPPLCRAMGGSRHHRMPDPEGG